MFPPDFDTFKQVCEIFNNMDLQIILMTIIAFSAVISVLGFLLHWSINPLKEDVVTLKTGLSRLDARMVKLENKLDQLLARQK